MKHLLTTLLLATLCATGYGQTIKTLGYNTNGQVVYASTNPLTFTNDVRFGAAGMNIQTDGTLFFFDADGGKDFFVFDNGAGGADEARARQNLGLGATWLTNTNVTNFRTAIGLGASNDPTFNALNISDRIVIGSTLAGIQSGTVIEGDSGIALRASNDTTAFVRASTFRLLKPLDFSSNSVAETTRANLGLGATNNVHFNEGRFDSYIQVFDGTNVSVDISPDQPAMFNEGFSTRQNIVIANQTASNNGLLFIYRTNNEPFLGLANLIASNNTTISNETLFRVGVAEATNKAAQFGFRSTNTNGSGVAVFSVFGYNALMMIGADASTNAVVYSGGGTNNEVMTLIRDGATEFARPIRFSTNAATRPSTNAPANTTNVAAWVEMRIGTNSYRVPLYQ